MSLIPGKRSRNQTHTAIEKRNYKNRAGNDKCESGAPVGTLFQALCIVPSFNYLPLLAWVIAGTMLSIIIPLFMLSFASVLF